MFLYVHGAVYPVAAERNVVTSEYYTFNSAVSPVCKIKVNSFCCQAVLQFLPINTYLKTTLDGTVPFLRRREFRATTIVLSTADLHSLCPGFHAVSSFPVYPAAFRHVWRFCGTQNLYLLPGHILISAFDIRKILCCIILEVCMICNIKQRERKS